MKEASFNIIFIFLPFLLWSTPLQDRIFNYSAAPNNTFNGSLIQSGIIINTNQNFTSYSLFSQYWISSNLALAGSIAPYIGKNDLYHYQYIGANYHSINEENIYSPLSFNIGMHRLINNANSGNDRWFNFGMNYFQIIRNQKISINFINYFTKNESLKIIGISHILKFFSKFNLNYGINYRHVNQNLSFKVNMELPI